VSQKIDDIAKKVKKQFVTNFDGRYPAKSSYGVFPELLINNDLGFVIDEITKYETAEE